MFISEPINKLEIEHKIYHKTVQQWKISGLKTNELQPKTEEGNFGTALNQRKHQISNHQIFGRNNEICYPFIKIFLHKAIAIKYKISVIATVFRPYTINYR